MKILSNKILRYRSGHIRFIWKYLMLILTTLAFNFIAAVPFQLFGFQVGEYPLWLISEVITILAVLFLNYVLERGNPRYIGLGIDKGWISLFGCGFILAFAAVSVIFVIELVLNQIYIVKINNGLWLQNIVSGFMLFILVGLAEEARERGYAIRSLIQGYSSTLSVVISSLVFAALHFRNPSFGTISFMNTFFVGIILAYKYVKTGSLWWSIGFHTAWNFFVGVGYGLPVSGINVKPLIQTGLKTANIFNGGKYGPEGGLMVTLILAVIFIYEWIRNRNMEDLL